MINTSERTVANMTTRNRSGTYQDIDSEISDLLIAISVKTRRLAHKVSKLSSIEKTDKGGKSNGQSKRTGNACRRA